MIVTIDGPAGVGKSSVAKMLAERLDFQYLDTGAMYRGITWLILEHSIDPSDQDAVADLVSDFQIQFREASVFVNDVDVTQAIRSEKVTGNVSAVADNQQVRARLVELQREIAETGNYVCEGRDQGTVAFPNAFCKIFLIATAEERAQRRCNQIRQGGQEADYESVLAQQNERDRRDYERPVGRLLKAEDAVEVITDNNTLEQVATLLTDIVNQKMAELEESAS